MLYDKAVRILYKVHKEVTEDVAFQKEEPGEAV